MSINNDSMGTHRPLLTDLVKNTTGHIIEFGCGNCSTVLIKNLIKNTNRKLISLESNKEWLNKFIHLEDDNHKFFFVDANKDYDNDNTANIWINFIKNNEIINNMTFEICFIDQSPWTARTHTLNYFKNSCKYLIVHDVDYFPHYKKWGTILKTEEINGNIKHEMDFSDIVNNFKTFYPPIELFAARTGPPTLLCSNLTTTDEFNDMCNHIDYSNYSNYI